MNVTKKELDANNAVVTIHVEKADYAEKVDKTLRDYRKKANMPGFRPGMVPLNLIKKLYGKSVLAEEINKLVSDSLYDYLYDNEIHVLGEPLPNETEQPEIDFDTQEDFDFAFDVAIAPEFEINVTKKDEVVWYNITVEEKMIDSRVKSYASRYGKHVQVETVELRDVVKGELRELEDGRVKEGGLHVKSATLIPDYMVDEETRKRFVGAKLGDTITFNPKKTLGYEFEVESLLNIKKEAAEKFDADCQITITEITRHLEAEINQELFDKVYGEGVVTDEAAFRVKIKEGVEKMLREESEYRFSLEVRRMLLKKIDGATFPDAFLKRWLLHKNEEMTEEQLENSYPRIIDDLKWRLIRDKLAKAYDVKVETAEIEAYAREVARDHFSLHGVTNVKDDLLDGYVKEKLKNEEALRDVVDKVTEIKVLAAVKSAVKVIEKEVTADELKKLSKTA